MIAFWNGKKDEEQQLADHIRTVLGEPVRPHNLFRLIKDIRHVDTDDLLGAGLGGKHGQDTGTAADLFCQLAPLLPVHCCWQLTSRTVLPLNKWGFCMMALR
jgi:hypothetical protein